MGLPVFVDSSRVQYKQITVTSAANYSNGGSYLTLGTVVGTVSVESVVVKSTGDTTADLTSIAVFGGASRVVTFISAIDGARVNVAAADQQVSWDAGVIELGNTKTIVMELLGTGATAVALLCTIGYRACSVGGKLT
jgi:hypothetical protein